MFHVKAIAPYAQNLVIPPRQTEPETVPVMKRIDFADGESREYPEELLKPFEPFSLRARSEVGSGRVDEAIDLTRWANIDLFELSIKLFSTSGDPHEVHEYVSSDFFDLYEHCDEMWSYLLSGDAELYLQALENLSIKQVDDILAAYEARPGKSETDDESALSRLVIKAMEMRAFQTFFENKEEARVHLGRIHHCRREEFALKIRHKQLEPCLADDPYGFVRQQKELCEAQLAKLEAELETLTRMLPPQYGDMRANQFAAQAGDSIFQREAARRLDEYRKEVMAVLESHEGDTSRLDLLSCITGPNYLFNYYGLKICADDDGKVYLALPSLPENSELGRNLVYHLKNRSPSDLEQEIREDFRTCEIADTELPPPLFGEEELILTGEQQELREFIGDRLESWSGLGERDRVEISGKILEQTGLDFSSLSPEFQINKWEEVILPKELLPSEGQREQFYPLLMKLNYEGEYFALLLLDKQSYVLSEDTINPRNRGIPGLEMVVRDPGVLKKRNSPQVFAEHLLVFGNGFEDDSDSSSTEESD